MSFVDPLSMGPSPTPGLTILSSQIAAALADIDYLQAQLAAMTGIELGAATAPSDGTVTASNSGAPSNTTLSLTVTTGARPIYVTYGCLLNGGVANQVAQSRLVMDGNVVDVATSCTSPNIPIYTGTTVRLQPAAGSHTFVLAVANGASSPSGAIAVQASSLWAPRLYVVQG